MSLDINVIELRESLELRLNDVLEIIEINSAIIDITQNELQAVRAQLVQMGRGGGLIGTINNKISSLNNISRNPQIISRRNIIVEQVIVLFVGALESYLSDVVRTVGTERPDLFSFDNENEKISFSQTMLKDGFKLGDAILEHILNKKYSFQDLKSSLEVFKKYLSIDIEFLPEQKDSLILLAALRHVIVHNSSKIDRKFITQIRDTSYATRYTVNDNIAIDDSLIQDSKDSILNYADQITAAIINSPQL